MTLRQFKSRIRAAWSALTSKSCLVLFADETMSEVTLVCPPSFKGLMLRGIIAPNIVSVPVDAEIRGDVISLETMRRD